MSVGYTVSHATSLGIVPDADVSDRDDPIERRLPNRRNSRFRRLSLG